MSTGRIENISIRGMVCATPNNRQFTVDQTDRFDIDLLNRIVKETGVISTYRTLEKQTVSDLCYEAAEEVIKGLNWDKSTIGILVFVSHAADYQRPATVGVIQKRLSLGKECVCLDINLGCSGFVYGLSVIGSMMSTMKIKHGLLLCGDLSSKAVDPSSTSNLLFGDIGAAIAFEKAEGSPSIPFSLYSDGTRYKKIFARGGGFRHPEDKVNVYADMNGMDVMAFSITDVPRSIISFMKDNGLTIGEFDLVALHQANELIIRNIGRKIKAEEEKVPIVIKQYGNSSSSSIPLVICDHILKQADRADMHILACGFGLGLSWGVADLFIPKDAYINMIETNNYYDDDNDITVKP